VNGRDNLGAIAVRVEPPAPEHHSFGNVTPILHEVLHALERLADTGEPTSIDLRSLPFGPGEEERLEEALGTGEVAIRMDALGESRIVECAFPGVWLITHYNSHEEIMARMIEITEVPDIIRAGPRDMRRGAEVLRRRLEDADADHETPDADAPQPRNTTHERG
jgi:hydrogenase-1 operon protein HyaF